MDANLRQPDQPLKMEATLETWEAVVRVPEGTEPPRDCVAVSNIDGKDRLFVFGRDIGEAVGISAADWELVGDLGGQNREVVVHSRRIQAVLEFWPPKDDGR